MLGVPDDITEIGGSKSVRAPGSPSYLDPQERLTASQKAET